MDRQRFRLGAMWAALTSMFRRPELQRAITPEGPDHDEFHHARNKRQLHSAAFIRKYRRKRNVRYEMAFQSRKRNR